MIRIFHLPPGAESQDTVPYSSEGGALFLLEPNLFESHHLVSQVAVPCIHPTPLLDLIQSKLSQYHGTAH